MTFPESGWIKYINMLSAINDTAAKKFTAYLNTHETDSKLGRQAAIDYAYAIATQYGESAAAAACEMYDAVAEASGVRLPAAEPAPTAPYSDVAKAVNGLKKQDMPNDLIGDSIGRLVKRAGADTTLKNAKRDGAEFAWIPHGDTCSFCIMLASNGWQRASKKTLKGDHAEHIHANCDCTFAIRFDGKSNVEGYDPDRLREIYNNAEGNTWEEKLNSMRRDDYAKNADKIRAQKREAYALKHPKPETTDKAIKAFEENAMSKQTETGLLIRKDGSTMELAGIEHHVQGNRDVLNELDGGTFTHNHPQDVTFSDTDIANGIAKGNLKELRAITSEGNLHQLINNNATLEDRRKLSAQYANQRMKLNNIANQKIARGEKINKAEYINSGMEKWLSENASKYNFSYKKTNIGKSIAEFVPSKTIQEAEEFAKKFSNNVNFSGISLGNANEINKQLSILTNKYPTNKLEEIISYRKSSAMSGNYRMLGINGKNLGKLLSEEAKRFAEDIQKDKETINLIEKRFAGKKLPFSAQSSIDKLKEKSKYKRFGVQASYDNHVGCVLTHEYGHILSDQYFGMINREAANINYSTDWRLRNMTQKWESAFNQAIKNGDIYSISYYAKTNVREFFAECFAAREMGETLPDYIESLMAEVLNNGIM